MPQNPRTEYDKPWYPAKKDYLKDAKEITISFDRDDDDERELPSQVQYMQATSEKGMYKFQGSISSERDDLGFGDTNNSGIGDIVVGLGSSAKKQHGPNFLPEIDKSSKFEGTVVDMRGETLKM